MCLPSTPTASQPRVGARWGQPWSGVCPEDGEQGALQGGAGRDLWFLGRWASHGLLLHIEPVLV